MKQWVKLHDGNMIAINEVKAFVVDYLYDGRSWAVTVVTDVKIPCKIVDIFPDQDTAKEYLFDLVEGFLDE